MVGCSKYDDNIKYQSWSWKDIYLWKPAWCHSFLLITLVTQYQSQNTMIEANHSILTKKSLTFVILKGSIKKIKKMECKIFFKNVPFFRGEGGRQQKWKIFHFFILNSSLKKPFQKRTPDYCFKLQIIWEQMLLRFCFCSAFLAKKVWNSILASLPLSYWSNFFYWPFWQSFFWKSSL